MKLIGRFELIGAYLEITSECNLRCIHCYNDSGQKRYELTVKDIENVCDSLCKANVKSIALSGGEPFMHKNILDFLDVIADRNLDCVIITNATLIDKSIAERIHRYKVSFQVSINGSNAEIHDKVCGRGSFDKTLLGIYNLLEAYGSDKINIHSVITKINLNDTPNIIKLVKSLHINDISFSHVNNLGRAIENDVDISIDEVDEFFNRHANDLVNKDMNIKFPEITGGCPICVEDDKNIGVNPRIDSRGNVHMCQTMSDKKYCIGNIKRNNLLEIINSEKMSDLADFLKLSRNYISECEACVWKKTCAKGCPAAAINNYDSPLKTDGCCKIRNKNFFCAIKNKEE